MGFGSFGCPSRSAQPQIPRSLTSRRVCTRRDQNGHDDRAKAVDQTPVVKSQPVVALEVVSADVQAAYDYFETRLPGAGERFLTRYFATADKIASNAETFPLKFDDYRRALVRKSNLAVYYFIEHEQTVIVAVIDARRHPRLMRDLIRGRRD